MRIVTPEPDSPSLLNRIFPGAWSVALWPLAIFWMVVAAGAGCAMTSVGGKGGAVGFILTIFAPLPFAVLATRNLPDVKRKRLLSERRAKRLDERLQRAGGRVPAQSICPYCGQSKEQDR